MELRSIRYFVTIVESGSLTRASRSLFVAQPALSHHVAALEEELGVRLLHRSPKGVTPTDAGEILYRSAVSILKQVSQIPAQIKRQEGMISGRVTVGMPTSTAEIAAIPLLQAISTKYPSVKLDIDANSSGHLLEWLINGRLDFSLLFITEPANPIVATPLLSEELCLISLREFYSAGAPGEPAVDVALDNIRDLPLVLPPQENGLRTVVDSAFESIGASPNIMAELGSLQTLRLAVSQGVAATILPLSALPGEWHDDSFFTGRITDPTILRTITICTNTDVPLNPAAHKVLDEVISLFKMMYTQNSWPGHVRLPPDLHPEITAHPQ